MDDEKPDATTQPSPPNPKNLSDDDDPVNQKESPPEKSPSWPIRMWKSLGLDWMTLTLMFKGALAPTIALAMYQAPSIAAIYSTLGYLVAIMTVLSLPIMPRAK